MNIDGIAALVAGGASGLGAATAKMLAEAGARVGILDQNPEAAEAAAGTVGGVALVGDVTDEAQVDAALNQLCEIAGAPRIAVNCAGVAPAGRIVGRDGPLPLDAFEKVIRINLIGSFNVMRLAAARMYDLDPLEDGARGVILNTASIAAFDGQIGQSAYSASKGAVAAMTLPAAREFARMGIRVNAIAPGMFLTPLLQGLPAEVQDSLGAAIPYPSRPGDPSEFAHAVKFCIENQYLNGEVIRLDGAVRLQPK